MPLHPVLLKVLRSIQVVGIKSIIQPKKRRNSTFSRTIMQRLSLKYSMICLAGLSSKYAKI